MPDGGRPASSLVVGCDDTIAKGCYIARGRDLELPTLIAEQMLETGQVLRLVHGDLTEACVDAIVNAANAHLAHGGGVAGAIVRRGGEEIQSESNAWIRQHGLVTHDKPAITGAGRLPCRSVIHAVGPVWGDGDEDAKLRAAVSGACAVAQQHGLASMALPAISTGVFGFPKERGARVIMDAIIDFLQKYPGSSLREVGVTLIDEASVRVFAREFARRWPECVR